MCGIMAFFTPDPDRVMEREMVMHATNLMTHRGPDAFGMHLDQHIGLGHRRLSIIDLAAGQQPVFNEDNSIALVYNGEIYNYQETRQLLIAKGHHFRSNCDTEVIVHAYEEWGTDCLQRFNGMFAFALWDKAKQLLWVVRDRLGVKPLYYYSNGKEFVCASEIKPLFAVGLVKAEMNEPALDSYFSLGYVPAPETLFRGIRKLRPGHFLLVQAGQLKEVQYWDFARIEPVQMDYGEATIKLQALLKDCVDKCLLSDVPLGVFLSGGLDSSAVVAMMSELAVEPINSFTVGFDGRRAEGEERYAQIIAKQFRTRHHVFTLSPDDFYPSISRLVQHCEEPIVEPAAIALHRLSELARQNVKVLLSGEGSDEVFAGYFLYQFMQRLDQVQTVIPPAIWRLLGPTGRLFTNVKYRKYLDWLSLSLEQRYQGTSAFLTDSLKRDYYTADFYQAKGDYLEQTFAGHFDRVRHQPDGLGKMLYVDTKTWLVDNLLLKADKMTMAASVELRVPFLDHRLVEFASALPALFKCDRPVGKRILKSAMATKLPEGIIHRQKMGFPVPVERWFSGDLMSVVRERLFDSGALPWLNSEAVRRVVAQHERREQDHSKMIMSLLVLCAWQDHYIVRG